MPQTLLALLALAILTQMTFSQQQVTTRSYQNQLRDEFSVAASGMLMEVMELLAARPFDAQSAPTVMINRGIPATNEFGSLGPGGAENDCDLFDIDLGECNDLDDFWLGSAENDDNWWPAEVELSNGHTLPFEVHVSVSYVNGETPDIAVPGPTSSKRVVLLVRTPLLPLDGPFIHLERVIAFDANKAAADCRDYYAPFPAYADDLYRCSTPSGSVTS